MTNGLIRHKGSNIFAETFRSDHLVTGSSLAYCSNSEKQKRNSSVWLFQIMPSNLDNSYSVQDLPSPINMLSDETSCDDSLTAAGAPCDSVHFIRSSNSEELEFHFLKLKLPAAMMSLAFS